jgi:hypothetical protein
MAAEEAQVGPLSVNEFVTERMGIRGDATDRGDARCAFRRAQYHELRSRETAEPPVVGS